MNRDDLLKMLDLGGKEAIPEATDVEISPAPAKPAALASPTALRLDGWALRRGRDLLEQTERLRQAGVDEAAAADFHGCAFEADPQLAEDCVDVRRREFIEALLQTPDYRALHRTTLLDEAASCLAAVAFAEQFTALRKEEDPGSVKKDDLAREMETLRAVGRALARASEEVEEMVGAAAALGLGQGSAGSNDPRAIARLFKRVRGNATLRRICSLAGRFRRVAQSKQRRKAVHGFDDLVGVTLDGEVARLLPSELVRFVIDELEAEALRRLLERQCLCREHRGIESVAKGPILVTVDESGSMEVRHFTAELIPVQHGRGRA